MCVLGVLNVQLWLFSQQQTAWTVSPVASYALSFSTHAHSFNLKVVDNEIMMKLMLKMTLHKKKAFFSDHILRLDVNN